MKLYSASFAAIAIAGAVFTAAGGAMLPQGWLGGARSPFTDNAYVRGDVTPLSPRVSGYVVEVAIRDNQRVRAGDVLFRIDDRDYRARVAQAAAAVAARRAALADLGSQIALQGAVVDQSVAAQRAAEAEATRAALDFNRIQALAARGFASRATTDRARADHLQADAHVAEAYARAEAARRQIAVLETQRPQLLADIAAAEASLRLAQIDLDNTVVRAPADGRVSERQARIGQYVRPGTLMIAIVSGTVWVVANFKETQIPAVPVGSRVEVRVDGLPGRRFAARVQSLSPASGAQFALLPPDNATGNFTRIVQRIPVKIVFDAGQAGLQHLRPGMSASVGVPSR